MSPMPGEIELDDFILSGAFQSLFGHDEEVDGGMPALVPVEENRLTSLGSVTPLEANLLDILLQPASQQPTSEKSAPLQLLPQLHEKIALLKGEPEESEPHVLQKSLVSDKPVQQPTILQPKAITGVDRAELTHITAHPMSSFLVVDNREGDKMDFRMGALQFITQEQNRFKANF
jgi:hypothetical protein